MRGKLRSVWKLLQCFVSFQCSRIQSLSVYRVAVLSMVYHDRQNFCYYCGPSPVHANIIEILGFPDYILVIEG